MSLVVSLVKLQKFFTFSFLTLLLYVDQDAHSNFATARFFYLFFILNYYFSNIAFFSASNPCLQIKRNLRIYFSCFI